MSNSVNIPEIAITLDTIENSASNNIAECLTDVEDLDEGEMKKSRSKLKIKLDNVDDGAVTDIEDLEGSDSDESSSKLVKSVSLQNVVFENVNCEETVKNNKGAKGNLQKQLSCFKDTLQIDQEENELLTDVENIDTDNETDLEKSIPDTEINLDEFQPEVIKDSFEYKSVENNVATKNTMCLAFPVTEQKNLTDVEVVDSDDDSDEFLMKRTKQRRRKSKNCIRNVEKCVQVENKTKRCPKIKKSFSQPFPSNSYQKLTEFDSDDGKNYLKFPLCQKVARNEKNMILTDTEDLDDDENIYCKINLRQSHSSHSIQNEKENTLSLKEALELLNSTEDESIEGDYEPKNHSDIVLPPPNCTLVLLHENKSIIPTTKILPLNEKPTGLKVDNDDDGGVTDIENFNEPEFLGVIDEYQRGPTPDICGYEGSCINYEDQYANQEKNSGIEPATNRPKRTKKSKKHLNVVNIDLPTTDTEDVYLSDRNVSDLKKLAQTQANYCTDGTDIEEFDTDDETFSKKHARSFSAFLRRCGDSDVYSHDNESKTIAKKPVLLAVDNSKAIESNVTDVEDVDGSGDEDLRSMTATPNEFEAHLQMQQSSNISIESRRKLDLESPNEIMYLKGGSYRQTFTDVEEFSDENVGISVNVQSGSVCYGMKKDWDVAKKPSPTERSAAAQDAEQQAASTFITYESVLLAPDCNLPSSPTPPTSYKQIDDMLEKMLIEVEKQEKLFSLDLDLLEPCGDDSYVNTLELKPETDALIEIPVKKSGLYLTYQEIQIDTNSYLDPEPIEEREESYLEDTNHLSVALVKDAHIIASAESLTDNEYLNQEIEHDYEPVEYNALTHVYQRLDLLPETDIWFEGTYRNLSIVPEEDEDENVSLLSNISTNQSLSSNRYSCYESSLQQHESDISDSDESSDESEVGTSFDKGESIVKAEVKLLVKTTDQGKEAIEIRSVREFVENPTSKPAESTKKSQFGEKLASFRNKISSIVERSKKNLNVNIPPSESSESLLDSEEKKPSFTFQQLFLRTPESVGSPLQNAKKYGSRTELVVNTSDHFPLEFNPEVTVEQDTVDLHANIPFYPCYSHVDQYEYKPVLSPHTNPFTETISNPFNECDQIPRAYCDWLEDLSGGISTTTERLVASNEEKLLDKPVGQQPLTGLSDIDDNLVIDLETTLNQTNAFIQSESQPEPYDPLAEKYGIKKLPSIADRKSDDNKNNINEKKKAKKGFFGSIKTFVKESFESDSDSEKSPKKSKKPKKDKKKKGKTDDTTPSTLGKKPKLPTPPLEPHDLDSIPYVEASPSDLPPPYKPPAVPEKEETTVPVTDLDVEVDKPKIEEEPAAPSSPKKKVKSKTIIIEEVTKTIEPLVIEAEEFSIVVDPTKKESPKKSKETFTINIDESIEKIEKEILEKSPILSEEKIVKPLADLDLSTEIDITPIKPIRLSKPNIFEDIDEPVVSLPPDHTVVTPAKFEDPSQKRRVSYKDEPEEIIDKVIPEDDKEVVEKHDKELSKEKKGGFFGLFKKRDSRDSSVEKKIVISETVQKEMDDSRQFLNDEVKNYHDVRPTAAAELPVEDKPKEEPVKEPLVEEDKSQSSGFFGLFKKSKKDEAETVAVKEPEPVVIEAVQEKEVKTEHLEESKPSGGLFGIFKKSKKDEQEPKPAISETVLKDMEDTTKFLKDEVNNYEDVKLVESVPIIAEISQTVEKVIEKAEKEITDKAEQVEAELEKPIEATESSGFFGFFKKSKKDEDKPEKSIEVVEEIVKQTETTLEETKKVEEEIKTAISRESSPKPSGFFGLFKKSKKDDEITDVKPAIPEAALREISDTTQFITAEIKNYHDVKPIKFDVVEPAEETIDLTTKPPTVVETTEKNEIKVVQSKEPVVEKEKIVRDEVVERSPKPSRGLFNIFRKSKEDSQEAVVISQQVLKDMNDTNQFLVSEVENYHDVKPAKFEAIKVEEKLVKVDEPTVESSPKPSRGFFSSIFKKSKEDSVDTSTPPQISETTQKEMNETDQFLVEEVQNYEDVKPVAAETKIIATEKSTTESSPKTSRGIFGLLKKSKEPSTETPPVISEAVVKEMSDTKEFLQGEVTSYHDVKPEKFEPIVESKPVEEIVEVPTKQSKGLFSLFKKSKDDSIDIKPILSEAAIKDMSDTRDFLNGELERYEDVKLIKFPRIVEAETEPKLTKTDEKEVESKQSRGIFSIFKKSKKDEDELTDTKTNLPETVLKDMHDSSEFLNKEIEKYHDVMPPTIVITEHPPPKVESSGFLGLFKKSKKDDEEPQEIQTYVSEVTETVQKETKTKDEAVKSESDPQETKGGFLSKFKITKKRQSSQEHQISEEVLKHMIDTGNFLKNELENYEDGVLIVEKTDEKIVTFQETEKEVSAETEIPQIEKTIDEQEQKVSVPVDEEQSTKTITEQIVEITEKVAEEIAPTKTDVKPEVKKSKKDKQGKDKKGLFNIFGKKSKSQDAGQEIKRDEDDKPQKRRKSSSPFKFFEKSKKSEDETKEKEPAEVVQSVPEIDVELKDDILTIEFDEQPSLAEEVLSSLDKKMENLKNNYSQETLKKIHDCRDFLFIEVDNYDDVKPVVVTDIDKDLEEDSKVAATKTVNDIIDLATTTVTEELTAIPALETANTKAIEVEEVEPAEPQPKPAKKGFFSKLGNILSGTTDEVKNEMKKAGDELSKVKTQTEEQLQSVATNISQETAKVRDATKEKADKVAASVEKSKETAGEFADSAKSSFLQNLTDLKDLSKKTKDAVVEDSSKLTEDAKKSVDKKIDDLEKSKDKVTSATAEKVDQVKEEIDSKVEKLQDQREEAVDSISGHVEQIKNGFHEETEKIHSTIEQKSEELKTVKKDLVEKASHTVDSIKSEASQQVNIIKEQTKEKIEESQKIVTGKLDYVKETASNKLEDVKTSTSQKVETIQKSTDSTIEQISQKIDETKKSATDEVEKVIEDSVKKTEEVKKSGAETIESVQKSTESKIEELTHKVEDTKKSASEKVEKVVEESTKKKEDVKKSAGEHIDAVKKSTASTIEEVSQKVDDTKKSATEQMSKVIEKTVEKTEEVKKAGAEKIENLQKSTESKIEQLSQKVEDTKKSASEKVEKVVEESTQKIKDVKKSAGEQIEAVNKSTASTIEEVSQKVDDTKKSASEQMTKVIEKTVEKTEEVKKAGAEKIENIQKSTECKIEQLSQIVEDTKKSASEKVEKVVEESSKKIDDVKKSGNEQIETVKKSTASTIEQLSQKVDETKKSATDQINKVTEESVKKAEEIKKSGAEKIENIQKSADSTIEQISQKMEETKKAITQKLDDTKSEATKQTSEKIQDIKSSTTEKVDEIKLKGSQVINDFSDKKQEIVNTSLDKLKNGKEFAKESVEYGLKIKDNVVHSVSSKVEESKEKAEDKIQEIISDSSKKTEEIKTATKEKIDAVEQKAADDIKDLKQTVGEKINDFDKIKENSKATISENIGKSKGVIIKSIETKAEIISQKIDDSKNFVKDKSETIVGVVSAKTNDIEQKIAEKTSDLKQLKDTVVEDVSQSIKSVKEEKSKSGEDLSKAKQNIEKLTKTKVGDFSEDLAKVTEETEKLAKAKVENISEKTKDLSETAAKQSTHISSQLEETISIQKSNLKDLKQEAEQKLDNLLKSKDQNKKFGEEFVQKTKDSVEATAATVEQIKLQQVDKELEKLTSSMGPIVGETKKKTKKEPQSYVTSPTKRAESQKISKDQRPTVVEVRMKSEDEIVDDVPYTVTEPDDFDEIKRKPLFHLESEDDDSLDVVSKPRERSDSVKSNVLETLTEKKLENLFTTLESEVVEKIQQTVTDSKEVKEKVVADAVAKAEETLETIQKDSQADVDQIEKKLRDLDKALESLEQTSDPKLERKLHRVERKFERMASEVIEGNDASEVSPTEVEARREHEFQRLVSQLSTEEVSDFQKEYSHLWDETTFSKSDDWDSKTPDSQVDVQELPQGEVVYLGPVTLNKDNLVNKAGIEVDIIPIMKSPCHSPKPTKKNKRAKSAMDFYDSGRNSPKEFDRGSLPDLKTSPLKGSLVHTIIQMNPDRFLYGSTSSLRSTASSSAASELSRGEIMNAVLDWLEKSSPANETSTESASIASSDSSLSHSKPKIPTIRVTQGKSKKRNAKKHQDDKLTKDVGETTCAPTVTEELKIIPQPKPRLARDLPLNKIDENSAQLTKPDKQISPVRDDLLDDEDNVPETYSDKKKFWENVAKEPIAPKRMSLHEVSNVDTTELAKKRMSVQEISSVPTPKPRSVQVSQSIEETVQKTIEIVSSNVETGEVTSVQQQAKSKKSKTPDRKQSPPKEESPIDDRIMTEYQASFLPPTEMKRKSPPKVESSDSESDNVISGANENAGYISDSGDVEHYISDSEIEDRVPQIRERQMSVFAPPVAAVRKTIYERSSSLPTEDLYEVSARSIKLRKQYYEEQIKKEMIEEQLTSEIEEEPSPERKTLIGALVEQSSEDRTMSSVQDLVHAFDRSIRQQSTDDVHDIQDFMEITDKKEVSFDESHKPDIKTQFEDQGTISQTQPIETHKEIDLDTQTNRFSVGSEHSSSSKETKDESVSKPDSMEVHVDKSEIEDSEKLAELDQDVTDIETKSFDSLNATEFSPKSLTFMVDEQIPEITVTLSGKQRRISEESDEYAPKPEKHGEVESPINVPEEHVEDTVWEVSVQSQPEAQFDEKVVVFDSATVEKIDEDLSLSTRDESDLGSEIHQDHSDSYASDKIKSESHSDIERIILDSLHHQKVDPVEAKAIASALIGEIETEIERRECLPPTAETRDVSEYLKYLAETKGLDEREVELVESVLARRQRELAKLSRGDTQASSIEITDEDLRYSGADVVDTSHILEQQMSQLKAEKVDDMKSMAFLDKIDEKLIEETHTSRDFETYKDGAVTGHKTEMHTKTFEGTKSEKTENKDTIFEEDETISESTTHEYEQKDSRIEAVATEATHTKQADSEIAELQKSEVDINKQHLTDITSKTTTIEREDATGIKIEDKITESDTIQSKIKHEVEMTEEKPDEKITLKGELVADDFLEQKATTKTEQSSEIKALADGGKVETAKAVEQTHSQIVHTELIGEQIEETRAHKDEDCTIKQSKTSSTTTSIDVQHQSAVSSQMTEKIKTIDASQLDTIGDIKTVVVKHEEIKRTSSSDSKSSVESAKSPEDQFSTCSSGRKGDSDTSKLVEKPEVQLRKSVSLQKSDRKSGIEFEAYSSSGESHYHSFELDSGKSRPCSSDVEGLVAANSSEYESALTSQDYSARSHVTSTEYHTAVSSLSSKESMKSLDSESSGHLGSIEISEISETLVPSASDLEGDILDTGDQQLLEDDSWTPDQTKDIIENDLNDVQSKMKRSHEMTFQPEPKILAADSPQSDEVDKKLFTSMDEGSVVSMSLSSTSATEPQTVIELSRTDSEKGGSMTVSAISDQLSVEGSLDSLVFHPQTTPATTTDMSTSTGISESNLQIESITFTTSVVDESGIRSVSTQVTSETHTPEDDKTASKVDENVTSNGSCYAEMKKKGHRRQESTSFVPSVLTGIKTEMEHKIHSELAESDKYTAELSLKEVISDEKKDVDEKEKEESYETEADQGFHQDIRDGKYHEEPEDEIKDDTPEFSSETQASVGELEQEYNSALARSVETKKKFESSSELHFHKEPLEKRDSHGKSSSTSSEKSSFEEAEAEAAFNMVAHISPAHKIKQICPILEDEDAEKHELETRERAQKEFEKRRSQMRDQSPGSIPDIKVTQHMTPLVDRNFYYPDLELEEQERLREEKEKEAQKSTPQTPSSKSSEDTDQGREYVLEDSGISIPEEPATESKSTVIEQTFKEDADKDTDSPNSDSFEMLEKPDLIDDFVVIEEVAKEAQECDSEGKSMHIQQKPSAKKKKHDEEVEAYLAHSAPTPLTTKMTDVKYYPDGSSSDELGFEFEDSPPINNAGTATSYDQELEANKKWIEQQFQGDQAARMAAGYDYEMDFERGPLEDIKEEDINDFDPSSRIGSLGSQKESGGSLGGSIKDSYSSTPEYDVLAGRKYFTRSGEHDDVSMSSLQEFETLERAMSLETRKYHGSQDSSSNGSFKTRYNASKSGQGDDVSVSSLKEFEGLEMACIAAHTVEVKAKEEEAMLAQIDEGQESLASESESLETVSRTDKKLIPDSDEEDYEKRMFEIDEIIRQAQTNVERFIELKEGDKTESLGRGDSIEEVSKVPDLELDVPLVRSSVKVQWKESDVMVTSTDSIEAAAKAGGGKGSQHDSTDSLDQKTGADIMTASTDSIEFQSKKTEPINLLSDSIEIKDEAVSGMISSDSLELAAHHKPADDMIESTDSLMDMTSSTATHATYQYETDSVFSGSFTSGGSNTMVSSTDTIEPVHVDIAAAARKVWFDEEAGTSGAGGFSTEYMRDTGKPYVTEVIEPCEDDGFSHTVHRRVELPPEVRKVTFYGSDADDRLKQFIEDFNEGEHVEEIEEVDEAGNIHTKRIVQKRFIVKGGGGNEETMTATEMDQFLKKSLASKTNQLTTAITKETTGEDSGVASSAGPHDSSSLKAQAGRRRQLRYEISVDDQIEVDPREHDWRFNLPEHVEGEESVSGSETVEKGSAKQKTVSDQHQLSDEMKELLKELEKESKQ